MKETMELKGNVYGYPQAGRPAVILLHGFCEQGSIWHMQAEWLAAKGWQVWLWDMPGFGKTPCFEQPPNMADYAQCLQAAIKREGIGEHLVVGHSMGGYIALAYAVLQPSHLRGLGLFHSTAFADTEEKRANRTKAAGFVMANGSAPFVKGMFKGLCATSHQQRLQTNIEQLTRQAGALAPQGIAHAAAAMRDRPDRLALLAMLNMPVFFAIGKQDAAVPFADSISQCHLPQDAVVHIWEHVGHLGMIEVPDRAAKALEGFAVYCSKISPLHT